MGNLSVAINKSRFHKKDVDFLGNVIPDKGISLSPEKVKEVKAWMSPNRTRGRP